MQTDDLINQLAGNVAPVKRLKPPCFRFALWLAVSLLYVAVLLANFGLREDLPDMLRSPIFIWQIGLMALLSVLAGLIAFTISIPGRAFPPAAKYSVVLLAGIFLATLAFLSCADPNSHAGEGWGCSKHLTMLGFVPAAIMIFMLKFTAPMQRLWTGILLGLAMIGISAAAMYLSCPSNDPLHVLVWHILPGFVFVAAGAGIASRLFRW